MPSAELGKLCKPCLEPAPGHSIMSQAAVPDVDLYGPPLPAPWVQANWSSVDFDYLGFAKHRWGEYFRRKDEFLAGAAAAFT